MFAMFILYIVSNVFTSGLNRFVHQKILSINGKFTFPKFISICFTKIENSFSMLMMKTAYDGTVFHFFFKACIIRET